jgi:hypothetical protein
VQGNICGEVGKKLGEIVGELQCSFSTIMFFER